MGKFLGKGWCYFCEASHVVRYQVRLRDCIQSSRSLKQGNSWLCFLHPPPLKGAKVRNEWGATTLGVFKAYAFFFLCRDVEVCGRSLIQLGGIFFENFGDLSFCEGVNARYRKSKHVVKVSYILKIK